MVPRKNTYPSLFESSGSSGSPYRRKDLTSLNRHYYLSAPTTRPSSARRVRPLPLLVSSRFSLVADRLSSPLSRLLIRASHSSPLSFVPLLRKSRGLCVFRKLKSLVKLKTEEFLTTKGVPWMDEFLNYERYGADGVLIDLLFVLDPAEKALFLFY